MYLVLLDLSAAFDTIDHSMLLEHLNKNCGLSGRFSVMVTYLSGPSQCITVNGVSVDILRLEVGVPQGSVVWVSSQALKWSFLLCSCLMADIKSILT